MTWPAGRTDWTAPAALARSRMACWPVLVAVAEPAAITVPPGPTVAAGAEA